MKGQKLRLWQERLIRNESRYENELRKMDQREQQYRGDRGFEKMTRDDRDGKTSHVRNLSAELIESQVNSNIPHPKVTPKRKQDEHLAKLIEDMLRNEMDRLPMEAINDRMERTVPIQGGAALLLEWDSTIMTPTYTGEVTLQTLHPKTIIPQDGVFTDIEDMDYVIIKVPTTKGYIRRAYGKDLSGESESEPDIRTAEETAAADDLVTMYIAYYRNDQGGIGKYTWACDTELEDLEDYQARRLRVCAACGAKEPQQPTEMIPPTRDGTFPMPEDERGKIRFKGENICPYCGGTKWKSAPQDYEEIWEPINREGMKPIPGAQNMPKPVAQPETDAFGAPIPEYEQVPTRVPYYKPNIYPVFLQKNVSVFGKLLGESDLDKIADQQNTTNRISQKIIDKLLQSGSYLVLPDEADIKADSTEMKVIRPGNAANAGLIGVKDLEGNISQDMAYLTYVYEEARQAIGITDSYQGRKDTTATSGKAKEFSAAQAAGRMESKRVMKNAMYQRLWEGIFKFKLAYADEPRPVVSHNAKGEPEYEEFNRWLFLEQDETGQWYWNDQFLFSCDTSAPLASNREAMWQELNGYFTAGAFGDPADPQTQILFWTEMEGLHYPLAANMKKLLTEQLRNQQQMANMQPEQSLAEQDVAQLARQAAREDMEF